MAYDVQHPTRPATHYIRPLQEGLPCGRRSALPEQPQRDLSFAHSGADRVAFYNDGAPLQGGNVRPRAALAVCAHAQAIQHRSRCICPGFSSVVDAVQEKRGPHEEVMRPAHTDGPAPQVRSLCCWSTFPMRSSEAWMAWKQGVQCMDTPRSPSEPRLSGVDTLGVQ